MCDWGQNNMSEVMEKRLNGDSIFRGRFFFCCISGEDVVVVTDNRRRFDEVEPVGYSDTFIPTVCGRCRRDCTRRRARFLDLDEGERGTEPDFKIDLSLSLIQGWETYKAVQKYCEGDVTILSQVISPEIMAREVKKYYVQMFSASMEPCDDRQERRLKILPYFDPRFL